MSDKNKKAKLKRNFISLNDKIQILDRIMNGEKPAHIAKTLNLNEATIRTIKNNEEKIRNAVTAGSSISAKYTSRPRLPIMEKMEKALSIWIDDCCQKKIPLDMNIIKQKSLNIYNHLKENGEPSISSDFVASKGWFQKFKKRFAMHSIKIHCESVSADHEAAWTYPEMSNTHNIKIHDFKNICRTCLSRENLKPLYEKCVSTTCLVDMLMSCTFIKFTEEDGLPMNICTNCIHEIKQAFAFGKRCEETDTILRECVNNFITQSTKEVDLILKSEVEMIPAETDVGNYEFVNVDIKEEDVQEEFEEYLEKVQDENLEIKYDETFEDPAVKTSTNSQIKEGNLKDKRSQLEPVRLSETNDQMYRCQTCEKSYKRLDLLKLHQKRSHASRKSHVCEVCSKTFIQSSDLKIHMRVHTREKPYTCEVCSHNFNRSQSLKDHMRIHTGEKTYTCKFCSKTFAFSGNLKTHMRMHTGEALHL